MREVLADRERGIAPAPLPRDWHPVTWAELAGDSTRATRRDSVYTGRHRRRLIARGLCTKCRARVESGAWRCDRCAAEVAALHRDRRARFKAAGLCQCCGRRTPAAGRECRPCLDALAARARAWARRRAALARSEDREPRPRR